ncbi:hypothetical protein [Singulisphaera acidiphila]|uniref:Uncharacterized protein n=1 Tax=Singulisphaera acidiphila (strain ATCC BAA-1392 / DSM 18658 / VKM B-2454 / MOB10) TaxID=886293 RepID=L0DL81_SINAD|nr:hypothetical protein [Singulisphaera acidiphila]AGA30154.1 hypothetical protein Sinac_6045 [Singulisphaera acidiphila DSM 18658]
MNDLISGQFAKLPREMLSKFEEFEKTTVQGDRQISQLSLQYKEDTIVLDVPTALPRKPSSSLTGCVVKQTNLDQFDAYRNFARRIIPSSLKTTGREVATDDDMAVLLIILEACTNNMNADRSMPTARIRQNWEILFANTDVMRPWCPRSYTALRDRLSEKDYIDWGDTHYLPGSMSPDGKGKTARRRASEALMNLLDNEKRRLQSGKAVVEPKMPDDERVFAVAFLE